MCFFVLLAVCGADPAGQVAYVYGTDQENQQVCVLDLATGRSVPVGPGRGDGAPVWSPDGSWLAYESRREGGIGVFVSRPDGSETRELKHAADWNRYPRWSPDGSQLVYVASGEAGPGGRCIVYDLNSQTESAWGGEHARVLYAVWMPNMKLLYALRPDQEIESDGKGGMTLLEWLEKGSIIAGIGLKQDRNFQTSVCLMSHEMSADLPDWVYPDHGNYVEWNVAPSPTGEHLAFESNDGGDREIYVLTKKGLFDVSNHRAPDWNPVWSPDGYWVAFESFRAGRRGIYRVYPDTARISPVAVTPDSDNWWPAWAPSSKWLAFISDRSGRPQIYVTDSRGQTAKQITTGPGYSLAPAWSPKRK